MPGWPILYSIPLPVRILIADLERTPRTLALRCCQAAKEAGLERVRMGNVHLLT